MMMTKIKRCVLLILAVWAFIACSKNEDPLNPVELSVDLSTVMLRPDSSAVVHIQTGNGGYTAVSTNDQVAKASLSGDEVTVTAISDQENAEAVIIITDRVYKRTGINVKISRLSQLRVDKSSVALAEVQASDTLAILSGEKPYQVSFSDPFVAKAIVNDTKLIITGKKNGKTDLKIRDGKGQDITVPVTVDGPAYAMNLSDQYFGYANFRDIAVVDPSIRQNKQITFEITCKIDGYRGLQTFMGLEGKLIMRGKNDDYKDTHPIQIAGLGDKIMLESTSSFPLRQWINLALVVDAEKLAVSDKYKLYINGVEDKLIVVNEQETHTSIDLASSSDGDRFEIGRAAGQDFRAMKGTVSEARVWTVARTARQIKDNMCTLSEERPEGLLARWDFSAGTGVNYIQDINGGTYETNLIIASINNGGGYGQIMAPKTVFVEKGCPNP